MPRTSLKKDKWTLSFDPDLKRLVVRAARRRGVYPVAILEEMVRERFNPYGHTDVTDSAAYVRALRRRSGKSTDEAFLEEIRRWQRSGSS
ncbi:MAG: hypothetical protein ACREQ9_10660 [Candidatus Binatia bacterium]